MRRSGRISLDQPQPNEVSRRRPQYRLPARVETPDGDLYESQPPPRISIGLAEGVYAHHEIVQEKKPSFLKRVFDSVADSLATRKSRGAHSGPQMKKRADSSLYHRPWDVFVDGCREEGFFFAPRQSVSRVQNQKEDRVDSTRLSNIGSITEPATRFHKTLSRTGTNLINIVNSSTTGTPVRVMRGDNRPPPVPTATTTRSDEFIQWTRAAEEELSRHREPRRAGLLLLDLGRKVKIFWSRLLLGENPTGAAGGADDESFQSSSVECGSEIRFSFEIDYLKPKQGEENWNWDDVDYTVSPESPKSPDSPETPPSKVWTLDLDNISQLDFH